MFQVLTTEQLIQYIKEFNWQRKPKEIHWHHTWKPNHSNFNGKNHISIQQGMKDYHTQTMGWSDIGQHLTLAPDGKWITGRDFNKDPASIAGRNDQGFSVEMLGNFDKGKDKLEGVQLNSAIEFGAFFIKFFNLTIKNNIFHREYANKTCPGNGIDKNWFINLIKIKLVEQEVVKLVTDYDNSSAKDAINHVKKLGIMNGYSDTKFEPNKGVTRGELAIALSRILKLIGK